MGDSCHPAIGAHHGLLWCECIDIVYDVQQRKSHRNDAGRQMGSAGTDSTQRTDIQLWRRLLYSIRFRPDLNRPRHHTGSLGVPD